jgi:hypothetical protein
MYKCGWNGCEKAYGTLNHLNAHVTMQSHGSKRTPEGEPTRQSLSLIFHTYIYTHIAPFVRLQFGGMQSQLIGRDGSFLRRCTQFIFVHWEGTG